MVLFMIGLGLFNEKDITIRGLQAIKTCCKAYLQSYTSILAISKQQLQQFYQIPVIEADRIMVQSNCDQFLQQALNQNIAFLVVGDPFGATTHLDLYTRAHSLGVKIEVIHNTSILTAVGIVGLYLYRYGQILSIPFFTENWRPYSFYQKLSQNKQRGLHTLLLLDIKVKQQSEEDLIRSRMVFQPPRFMTVKTACEQLLEAESNLQLGLISVQTEVVAAVRIGTDSQVIKATSVQNLIELDLGPPLHSLIIPGDLSEVENEFLELYRVLESFGKLVGCKMEIGQDEIDEIRKKIELEKNSMDQLKIQLNLEDNRAAIAVEEILKRMKELNLNFEDVESPDQRLAGLQASYKQHTALAHILEELNKAHLYSKQKSQRKHKKQYEQRKSSQNKRIRLEEQAKIGGNFLLDARNLILMQDQQEIEVFELKPNIKHGSPNKQRQIDSKKQFNINPMKISPSIKKLMQQIHQLIDQSLNKSNPEIGNYLKNIRLSILLYISLKTHTISQNIKHPFQACIYYTNTQYIIFHLNSLQLKYQNLFPQNLLFHLQFEDLSEILKQQASRIFNEMISYQQIEILSSIQDIELIQSQNNSDKNQVKMQYALQNLENTSKIILKILPNPFSLEKIGYLMDSLMRKLIEAVLKLSDICTQDIPYIKHLLQKVFRLGYLFEDEYKFYCKQWKKMEYLMEIFDDDLNPTLERYQSGDLKEYFTYYELRSLIAALFEESEIRTKAIRKIYL